MVGNHLTPLLAAGREVRTMLMGHTNAPGWNLFRISKKNLAPLRRVSDALTTAPITTFTV